MHSVANTTLFLSFHPQFLFQTNKATDSYQQLVEQGLPQVFKFLERNKGYENEHNALSNLRSQTKRLIQHLLQPVEPMGLMTHTDFWCNNLLFKENENQAVDCTILDWQMVTYSQPTNDIALLIISSLPAEVRRENTDKLLDLYYKVLKENCEKIDVDIEVDLNYSRNKLNTDYK
jgi:thiamine kinase-like enzyme